MGHPLITFSPDGSRLAVTAGDWIASIWDVATGEELRRFRACNQRFGDFKAESLVFSQDGSEIIVGGINYRRYDVNCNSGNPGYYSFIWKWNVSSGELIDSFDFQAISKEYTNDLALSPNGAFLAFGQGWSADDVGTVRLWQLLTRVNTENKKTPLDIELAQNYPNPFNSTTTIAFQIPDPSFVSLQVFDLLGRHVETLIKQRMSVGSHSVEFAPRELPNGMYLYKLVTDSGALTGHMQLVR